jgi:hypothetical protein
MSSYDKLNKLFRRFSIQVTEMCGDNNCFLEAIIYNGMGDFTVFKASGENLDDALNKVIEQRAEYYGISVNELLSRIGEA